MESEQFKALRKNLIGKVILPEDQEYDAARKVYNGMISKSPALIVQCANNADVVTCVDFARVNNLLLAVRGGGHNAGGLGICDDGLVIDLSRMKNIQIDSSNKTARVQGGCLLKELDAATHEHDMAVPSGILGTTGVAGLTLGGGLGHLTRHYGLSIDNLLEVEIVLADGRQVKASAKENADLFWAVRGGGGNFGVVVSFLFRLREVSMVYGGPMLWDMKDAKALMKWYHQFMTNAPEDINGFFAFLTVPPVEPFPKELWMKKMCGIVWCYTGDADKAVEIFDPIRAVKVPALDFVGKIPFPALQTMFDGLYPPGLQWYWKAHFVKDVIDAAIDVYVKYGEALPTPLSSMHMYPVNGAASRLRKDETAWNYRDAQYAVVIVGVDADEANKDKITRWATDHWNDLRPYAMKGAYVNFMMPEGEDGVKSTYGENYARLAEIKAKYDPDNLFRINQNIKPKAQRIAVHDVQ